METEILDPATQALLDSLEVPVDDLDFPGDEAEPEPWL